MKITGTQTEKRYRQELEYSKSYLRESETGKNVLYFLVKLLGEFKTAYVLTHTPEQGEDVFRVLVDAEKIIGFDLQHGESPRKAENVVKYSVKEYEKLIGNREARLILAIAIDLSEEDLRCNKK